ncbi:hypothetical protein EHS25_004332 [Saitozyma podzolica]|uniref:GPI inositol-deacylase n=1 Tax=Saitozyma podzolica TaxID=1890683 RepID=A0A427YTR8_9TREE|nr:hypothetical protein EHS25_004332 [Saitozyma podzolica]
MSSPRSRPGLANGIAKSPPHANGPDDASPTSPSVKLDKGKGRAADMGGPALVEIAAVSRARPATPLTAALDEAMQDELPPPSISSSVDSSYTPISPPPRAHHPSAPRVNAPRLLSQLTRSTLPISSLSYASASSPSPRQRVSSWMGLAPFPSETDQLGESSTAWMKGLPTTQLDLDAFPDLDPTTGLPYSGGGGAGRESFDSDAPSLHLQRTITDLLSAPTTETSASTPSGGKTYLPSLPPLPSLSSLSASLPRVSLPSRPSMSLDLRRTDSSRSLSTTAQQNDWSSWTSGWWGSHKSKVDELMSEEDQAETVEEEKAKLRSKYRTPKNPLVFCHGLLGFDYIGPASLPPLQISHWRGIREVLEANGVDVLICRVPATSSIKDRAAVLEDLISERYPGQEVNLIGHSMGGLDCRYLISQLRPTKFKPISLTTISTPHRGSPFADYVVDNVIGRDNLPSLLSLVETLRLPQTGDGSAFSALGTRSMKDFNTEIIDLDDVKYYSWGASFEPGLLDTFKWPHSVILAKEGPNDGLVSVHSAKWGEYRGTLLGVNHLDLVGWVNHVRYVISGWTGNPIAFKPATFYLEISDYLAEQGF